MTDKTYTAEQVIKQAAYEAGTGHLRAGDMLRAYAATLRQAGAVEAKAREMYEAYRSEYPDARMYSWDQQPFAPTKEHWREKARAALARPASSEPASGEAVANLRERLGAAHDASLDDDHRGCRSILMTLIDELDAQPHPAEPVKVPEAVTAWVEAKREYKRLVGVYNDRVAYARQHDLGRVSVDHEYQAMCAQQRVMNELVEPMFAALAAAPGADGEVKS